MHTRGVPLAPDVDLGSIASTTPGMVGADLANLVNEAALLAARRSHKMVEMADFTDAVEKIVLGVERRVMMTQADRERTAYHEAGHALVGMLSPDADPVRKVSIIPRGMALGVTFSAPDSDRFNYDEAYLKARLRVALGGRVAEELVYDSISSGAESDIQQMTAIARQMVGRWGMSPAIGPVAVLPADGDGPLLPGVSQTSEDTQKMVDAEVRRLADEAHADATDLLRRERSRLDALTKALLEAETLDEEAAYAAAGVPHVTVGSTTPARPRSRGRCACSRDRREPHCEEGRDDMTELWRGFANMAATKGREVVIAKGRGSTVWDDKGKSYLDSTASLWYMNVGYGRDEIADAVGAQLKELAAFHTFGPFANPPLLELADKVAELSKLDDAAVFFTSGGGSDAVDTAAKLARRYWTAMGRPEKQIIISREHGYHGVNGFGTSLQGIPLNRAGYGDLMPHIENVPWGDADALERLLADHGDQVAAFIGEPVIGAGGVIPPPEGFWTRVRGALPAPRRAADLGRGHLRLRPSRRRLRLPALRHRARPDDLREGPHIGLRADGRRRRLRSRQAAVLGGRLERALPPRVHLRRPSRPRRRRVSRISPSSSAKGWSSECASWSRCSPRPTRSASTAIRWSPRCARSGSRRQSSSRPRRWRPRRASRSSSPTSASTTA